MTFFPWGYIEGNLYHSNPAALQDLKTAVTRFVKAISAGMFKRVIENLAVRLNECVKKKLLQTEEKLELKTSDMTLCDMLQNNIWQISVSERVQFFFPETYKYKEFPLFKV